MLQVTISAINFSTFDAVNVNTVILISSLFLAIGVFWKAARFIFKVDGAMPTLLKIAAQFENNGGSTLKDKVDNLYMNQAIIKEILDSKHSEITSAQTRNTNDLKSYFKENMQAIKSTLKDQSTAQVVGDTRLARMEHRLDNILINRENLQ